MYLKKIIIYIICLKNKYIYKEIHKQRNNAQVLGTQLCKTFFLS